MKLTQDEYQLLTGGGATSYTDEEWATLEGLAEARLASFLCREELPDDAGFTLLLANFMFEMLKVLGSGAEQVKAKTVRNFRIDFETKSASAFATIGQEYGDLIDKYSQCDLGLKVERSSWGCC